MAKNRDDFTEAVRRKIGQRAGWLCSFPGCGAPTEGATSDDQGRMSLGTASHICAAAPGGPRYDESMSPEARRSVMNGIWMCRNHGTAIDAPDPQFTTDILRRWKKDSEAASLQRVLAGASRLGAAITANLHAAAAADMEVFRRTNRWPASTVELTLRLDRTSEAITSKSMARAAVSLDDLVLVAPPGMGKSTVLLQVAEGMLSEGTGLPLFVSLADWATDNKDFLTSLLHRPCFQSVSEGALRAAAAKPGVVLLLDGWNELDAASRQRARVQLVRLKAELPNLGMIISTRQQSVGVPIEAMRIDLEPLSYGQQEAIARELAGDAGVRLVDKAWRTPGIRDLVTIPLYLTVLLSLPRGTAFPTTKEALLRSFVRAHEAQHEHAEALRGRLAGLHDRYLRSLAASATRASAVALSEEHARRSVAETSNVLLAEGQISSVPQPHDVLDTLVSNHVLQRAGDAPGYSFQHQQFQEWYASHEVEDRIARGWADPTELRQLQLQIFDVPAWEEATLFAVERLSLRNLGSGDSPKACACAVLAALEVDPLLAAEMVHRGSEVVWDMVAGELQKFARAWHVPGKIDRALRLMLTSGRPEFRDVVWPLASHENEQTSLSALRNCRQLRPSVLGRDAAASVAALPKGPREVLLHELAMNGDLEGLDFATALAKSDADSDVQVSVITALLFRRADHHVVEILRGVSDATLDQLALRGVLDEDDISDAQSIERLRLAKQRVAEAENDFDRLQRIARTPRDEQQEIALFDLLSRMKIAGEDQRVSSLVRQLQIHYPEVVAKALLARVREGRAVFYGAADVVSAARLVVDDEALLRVAQEDLGEYSQQAFIAASVLGPRSAAAILDRLFELDPKRKVGNEWNHEIGKLFHNLERRLALASAESILEAVVQRSADASVTQIALMAEVLVICRRQNSTDGRPFTPQSRETACSLVEDWARRMLASGVATRSQTVSLARLAACAASDGLLPVLQALLDDNLQRLRAFRAQAEAEHWRHGEATNEARSPHTHEYARAFLQIPGPDTRHILNGYLGDLDFGEDAAGVLAEHWRLANEPMLDEARMFGRPVFSQLAAARARLEAMPDWACEEADAIFKVIQGCLDAATVEWQRHAIALGIRAVRIPHGKSRDVVERLLAVAPRQARRSLLMNLALSGAVLPLDEVSRGINETLDAAKEQPWILTQSDGYELRQWLQFLPLTEKPLLGLDHLHSLPDAFKHPTMLEDVVLACQSLPGDDNAQCLLKLAEQFPEVLTHHRWHNAVFQLAMESADVAQRLVALASQGAFVKRNPDRWFTARGFAQLIEAHPQVRAQVYELLADGPTSEGLLMLAEAVSETPDTLGLMLLLKAETLMRRRFADYRAVEHVATERIPSSNLSGAFEILPAPVADLRRALLPMCTDGGTDDAAARCLRAIDAIRDTYGLSDLEPRHPHLASGIRWPILNIHCPHDELY